MKTYYKYWGKARKKDDSGWDYHLLPYHCLDVAAVGQYLADRLEIAEHISQFEQFVQEIIVPIKLNL